eukprot:8584830-Ditylum_brightwellii.AAC.2
MKLHGYDNVKGGQHQIGMSLKIGYRSTTSSIKQCLKLSEHLHYTFVARSLKEMNTPGTKCFKCPELDETEYLQWDDEISERMHTCMLGVTVTLTNEEPVKQNSSLLGN